MENLICTTYGKTLALHNMCCVSFCSPVYPHSDVGFILGDIESLASLMGRHSFLRNRLLFISRTQNHSRSGLFAKTSIATLAAAKCAKLHQLSPKHRMAIQQMHNDICKLCTQ